MKPRRALLAVVVIMATCMLLLPAAGCGPGEGQPTEPVSTTGIESGSAVTPVPAPDGIDHPILPKPGDVIIHPNVNAGGMLPVVKNKETLQVLIAHNDWIVSYDYRTNRLSTWLEDRTNVHVEFLVLSDQETASFGAPLQGDVCLLPMDRATAAALGSSGVLTPLDGLILPYAPRLRKMLADVGCVPSVLSAPDGRIYTLPAARISAVRDAGSHGMRLWIHAGYLERYGGGLPSTTEELRRYLEWVRDQDADGNGDPSDEWGWIGAESRSTSFSRPTDFLMNAFVRQDSDGYTVRGSRIGYAPVSAEYRKGLSWLAALMRDGLMDPDYIDNDSDAIRAKVTQLPTGAAGCVSSADLAFLDGDPTVRASYIPVPPLTGPDGIRFAWADPFAGLGQARASIPVASTKQEIAMAWLDACYDEEATLRARFGELGTDWILPPSGTVSRLGTDARVDPKIETWAVRTYAHWYDVFPSLSITDGSWCSLILSSGESDAKRNMEVSKAYQDAESPSSIPPPLEFDEETGFHVAAWRSAIDQTARTAINAFITGQRMVDVDEEWDAYTAQLQSVGLDDCLAAMQDAYDRAGAGTAAAFPSRGPHARPLDP